MFVAFDGDDTLWHNENHFQAAHREFEALLSPWADADEVDACLYKTEMRNLATYGYGVKSFTLSMLETAVEISGRQAGSDVVSGIIDLGHGLLQQPAEVIDGVTDVLDSLADRHTLLLITKGDLRHQLARIESSGLAHRFVIIEVVADKNPSVYAEVLDRNDVPIDNFVMVGNSMRSDIAPVVASGGRAVHVPYHVTWAHESEHDAGLDLGLDPSLNSAKGDGDAGQQGKGTRTGPNSSRLEVIDAITDLPAIIKAWS